MQKFFSSSSSSLFRLQMMSGMRKTYTFVDRMWLNIGDKAARFSLHCFVWIYQHSIRLVYAL